MLNNLQIINPKRNAIETGYESWYPYYAGFSSDFASAIISSSHLSDDACILDSWNGSGTTTTIANQKRFATIGYDLNPVMIIAAKACLLNNRDLVSLKPLSNDIIDKARRVTVVNSDVDPLETWFIPASAMTFRAIDWAIQHLLVDSVDYKKLTITSHVENLSSIASFYYLALFRALRESVDPFHSSNPTWIRQPKSKANRLKPQPEIILNLFRAHVDEMLRAIESDPIPSAVNGNTSLHVATSCAMPTASNSVDLTLSSPPYCTRIDYAVATLPELTLLGYSPESDFDDLRRSLMGTSTVPKEAPQLNPSWGKTCVNFLDRMESHTSKASKSYYLKNHLQYFDSISKSISELFRVTKSGGHCVLVVQDSYYKDIHNDLPVITTEMAENTGFTLTRREDFFASRSMAGINPKVKKYRTKIDTVESVLCLSKLN